MSDYYQPDPETSILDDHLDFLQYEEASLNKRLLNWILDLLVIRFTVLYATSFLTGMLLGALWPEWINRLLYTGNIYERLLFIYLIWEVTFLVYFLVSEKAFKGYTVGKLITGTRAVRADGKELTFKDALIRTLIRLIPLETVSAIAGQPWHDKWSNTIVINTRKR